YLVTLEKKPAALDHAPVYRDWQLPEAFLALRQALEQQLGKHTATRHFIRVLQLLARHSLARVEQAITLCVGRGQADAAAITAQVERLAHEAATLKLTVTPTCDIGMSLDVAALCTLQLPVPDLSRFNCLLPHYSQGEDADDCTHRAAPQGQLEAAQDAD